MINARKYRKTKKTEEVQKTKIMASGPITSWEIDGETVETVSNFYFSMSQTGVLQVSVNINSGVFSL